MDTASVVPSNAGTYKVSVKGSTGTKTLTVTLNGDTYMIYAINFDTGNATLVEERGFSSGSSQQFPQESSNLDS